MSFRASPKQALLMWHLIITGDEPAISKAVPKLRPSERDSLKEFGLIELVKRGRSMHIVLTDKAWHWASEHFNEKLPKAEINALILQKLLQKIGDYSKRNSIPLAEILARSEFTDNLSDSTLPSTDIQLEIRKAYLKISGGNFNTQVRLAQLRQLLSGFCRSDVNDALLQMQRTRKLALMRLDDPQEIYPEDEEAAINIGGEKTHILYMRDW